MGRRLVPLTPRPDADRLGRLVYDVVGRYIAGTLFMAALAGVVTLVASLALGVPLAPLLAVWVAICNPIPQIGGFLGAVPFVALGLTQSAVVGVICLVVFLIYQQTENHVLQPLIIGRAVRLTPPATMVAALVGVAAGGVDRRSARDPAARREQGDLPRRPLPRARAPGRRVALGRSS